MTTPVSFFIRGRERFDKNKGEGNVTTEAEIRGVRSQEMIATTSIWKRQEICSL